MGKRIIIIEHARDRIKNRGANISEVEETIKKGQRYEVRYSRQAKEMVFPYGKKWQDKFYSQKKIRVIYKEEKNQLIVITVYVYFGK